MIGPSRKISPAEMRQRISAPHEIFLPCGDPNPGFDPQAIVPTLGNCRSKGEYAPQVAKGVMLKAR